MIDQPVCEIAPMIGTQAACRALGTSRASPYRRRRPPRVREHHPRPTPTRALSDAERARVLEQLHSERFVDCSPAEVWATLLDEGTYLASERTMYRILAATGEVRERRAQLTHPPYARPELLAEKPNELHCERCEKLRRECAGALEARRLAEEDGDRWLGGAPKPRAAGFAHSI